MTDWYARLAKPAWTPAPAVIGGIWSVLYPIIFIVFGYAVLRVAQGSMPASVLFPIALNMLSNLAFTPILFGLHNLGLAAADILIVLGAIIWCMVALWPFSTVSGLALIPYLVWVATATVLQLSIVWMNRRPCS